MLKVHIMDFIFIDESKKQDSKYNKELFALTGLVVNNANLINLENELREFKNKYDILHLKELRAQRSKEEKLNRTNEIVQILRNNDVKIISALLGKETLKSKKKIEDSYFDTLTFIIERFFLHLKKERRTGLIIHDSVPKDLEKDIQSKIYMHILQSEVIMYGSSKGFLKDRIHSAILFSNDGHCELLQVSDLISAALNHAAITCLRSNKYIAVSSLYEYNEFLKVYWPLFVTSSNGEISGWGIKLWW